MGFGVESFYFFKFLKKNHLITKHKSCIDIGSQEYDLKNKENNYLLEELTNDLQSIDPATKAYKGIVADLMKYYGYDTYSSYDIDGRFGSIPVNFNDLVNTPNEKADLVMNLGTTEHVFNQANVFNFIHNVTKKGGLMYHVLPSIKFHNHGLFSYGASFFWSLAYANNYKILGIWMNCSKYKNCFINERNYIHRKIYEKANIIVLMEKTTNYRFKNPIQINNPMKIHEKFDIERGNSKNLPNTAFNDFSFRNKKIKFNVNYSIFKESKINKLKKIIKKYLNNVFKF
jgi:hypothetical protein